MIPYDEVIENADRRWTARLLERLSGGEPGDEELHQLEQALRSVSDPRSFVPLQRIVKDTTRPARIREAASAALRRMHHVVFELPEAELRRCWRSGDPTLKEHALLMMGGLDCPDVVEAVAADPAHPLQSEAISRMIWWFDTPRQQAIKIAGMSHPDPKVRCAAADVVLWDEPLAALGPLITATSDADPVVAGTAANTLQYYPSLQTISCLHGLMRHPDPKVVEEAADGFQSIQGDILGRYHRNEGRAASRLRRWLAPVWELLAFQEDELRPEEDVEATTPRPPAAPPKIRPAQLLALLADDDASPRTLGETLLDAPWRKFGKAVRAKLKRAFLGHADEIVRDGAARAYAAWGDVGDLLALLRDASFGVRKTTIYQLGRLPPDRAVAAIAWDHLGRGAARGVHETETLSTYVHHAEPSEAVARLAVMATNRGERENVRSAAVHHLAGLNAAEPLRQLAGLLLEPPAVTWAFHLALLEAFTRLGLPTPPLGHLLDVDNLDVQVALAEAGV